MPNEYDGLTGDVSKMRFGIVVSRYNDNITGKLSSAAVKTLLAAGVRDNYIDIYHVPGAWELTLVADVLARKPARYAAVLCLGAVIRGETTHDQHINRAVSTTLSETGVRTGVPIIFGVLTCNSLEQAIHRSGGNVGNKGEECAQAALEMARILAKL